MAETSRPDFLGCDRGQHATVAAQFSLRFSTHDQGRLGFFGGSPIKSPLLLLPTFHEKENIVSLDLLTGSQGRDQVARFPLVYSF